MGSIVKKDYALSHPPPLSFCIVKTRSQQRRSNGRSDEKSRSLRADTERKGRATKIREKEQIKANLRWWSRPYLKSFKEWQRELEIIGQIVWLYTDNRGAPQKGLDNKLHLCLWRYFHISHRLTYSSSVTFHCCCQLEGRLCKTVFQSNWFEWLEYTKAVDCKVLDNPRTLEYDCNVTAQALIDLVKHHVLGRIFPDVQYLVVICEEDRQRITLSSCISVSSENECSTDYTHLL